MQRPARVVEPPPLPYYRALQTARSVQASPPPPGYDLAVPPKRAEVRRRRGPGWQLVMFMMALCGATGIIAYRNGAFHAWAQKANLEAAYVHWERELLGGPPNDTPLGVERFIQATKDERESHADERHSQAIR